MHLKMSGNWCPLCYSFLLLSFSAMKPSEWWLPKGPTIQQILLAHWGWGMHICIGTLGHHWSSSSIFQISNIRVSVFQNKWPTQISIKWGYFCCTLLPLDVWLTCWIDAIDLIDSTPSGQGQWQMQLYYSLSENITLLYEILWIFNSLRPRDAYMHQ